MNAQEFLDKLKKLSDDLEVISGNIWGTKRSYCENAVQRNLLICQAATNDDQGCIATNKAIRFAAATDGHLNGALDAAADKTGELGTQIGVLAEEFCALWNGNVGQLKDALAAKESKLQAIQERRKEHALHDAEVRETVWAMTDGKCFYCKIDMTRERIEGEPHRCFTVDHIVSKKNGGPDHLSNYIPACSACNTAKHARPFIEFWRRSERPDLKVVGESA